jgi:enoyl-CoA hydratase/carnithine racemase
VMTRVQRDAAFREQNVDEARRVMTGMLRCPLPIVAAVNGPAVGLGSSLVLLSDLVLMAPDAYLSDPHVLVGLVAGDGGALLLPLIVGPARAKELLFLGDRLGAADAVRLGIANRVVPEGEELLTAAMDLAHRLAALPAQALRETKRAVNLHLEQALGTVMESALLAERESMSSPEHIAIVEGIISRKR